MASFDADPEIPSVIDPDDPGKAGAYATLDQDRGLFAPLNDIPSTYRDYIDATVNAAVISGGAGLGTAASTFTVTSRLNTSAGSSLAFFGASSATGKQTISGDVQGNTALTSLLVALAAWGLITNSTTDSGSPNGGGGGNGPSTITSAATFAGTGTLAAAGNPVAVATNLFNTCEGTPASDVPNANAGAPNTFDSATVTGAGASLRYSSTWAHNGATSMLMTLPANVASTVYTRWSPSSIPTPTANAYLRYYINLGSFPPSTTRLSTMMTNGALRSGASILGTGKLNANGATAANALPTGQTIRIEHELTNINTAAGTGDVDVRAYLGDSSTPISGDGLSLTGVAVAGLVNDIRIGATNSTTLTAAWSVPFDDVAYSDQAQPGPMVAVQNLSGVYYGGTNTATADAFATWRNRPVDVLHTFASRASWSAIEAPTDATSLQGTAYAGSKTLLSVGMVPNTGGYTLAEGAAGTYDTHWANLGAFLVANGAGNCWIRFGWEYNLNTFLWSINPAASQNNGTNQTNNYVAYWRRIVNAMRGAGFTGKFIFSPSNTTNASMPDPALAYPGDTYVDAVMPDQYDKYFNHPSATPQDRWQNILVGLNAPDGTPRGLNYWLAFAKTHAKIFGSAEWGLWDPNSTSGSTSQGGGGDDPYYIDQYDNFLASARAGGTSTFELYFNADAVDGQHKIYPTGAYNFSTAAAEYRTKIGGVQNPNNPSGTIFGSSISPNTGESYGAAYTRTNNAFGPVQITREYDGGQGLTASLNHAKSCGWPTVPAILSAKYDVTLYSDGRFNSEFLSSATQMTPDDYICIWHEQDKQIPGNFSLAQFTATWKYFFNLGKNNGVVAQYAQIFTGFDLANRMNQYVGDAFCDAIGIDPYSLTSGETASDLIDPMVSVIRGVTQKPIIIGEIATQYRGTGRVDFINSLANLQNIAVVTWFNSTTGAFIPANGTNYDFSIDGDSAACAAFKSLYT